MLRGRKIFLMAALVLSALALLSFSQLKVSDQIPFPDLFQKLENYYRRYPQQKAYLHLDKLAYHAGEIIWYKAYLVDSRSHQPDTISQNLVVELVNSFGESSMLQLVKLQEGSSKGDFLLPDTIPQGLYRLRAYTNWMRNFGEQYFFSREINIWNPEHAANLYRDDKLINKRFKKKSQRKAGRLDVQFFPEGGYLVSGLSSRIGFKGINDLGLGVDIEGEILDRQNQSVAKFNSSHLGMGVFNLKPEANEKYKAVINTENGKKVHLKLPEVLDKGYVMSVSRQDESGVRVHIQSTYPDDPVFLACHIRGTLIHATEQPVSNGEAIVDIPLDNIPGGIMHVTLFDSKLEPRCERLIYVPSNDILQILIEPQKNEYGSREEVKLSLTVKDAEGKPVEENFSLAVSDRELENYAGESQAGILPSLLLTSDLAGRIEEPDFYFRSRDANTLEALDILMMTQGWRRFVWKDVINEEQLRIEYPIQKGLTVHGRITSNYFDRPIKNLPVTLTVLSEFNDVFISRTDDRGAYVFDLPDYEDTISVEITARRLSGRKNLVIFIDENDLPETEQFYSSYSRDMVVQGTNVFKPMQAPEEDTMQFSTKGIYYQPDYVLEVNDQMRTYGSVLQMIQGRIPGVQVVGDRVMIRGVNTFYGNTEPLFLVDNFPTDLAGVQSLNVIDVERIEVLKGPSAAIYGVRGANGVIAIFTRRGRRMIKGQLNFDMLGYHKPREFYSPRYGTGFDHLVTDYRSSLYWNPEVQTNEEGKAEISFYNSEKPGKYFIVIEGITASGQIGSGEKSYTVK